MKYVQIFLLVLIVIGVGLLFTQKKWVPKLVTYMILNEDKKTNTMHLIGSDVVIAPISHATMVLDVGGEIIYTDPVGGAKAFSDKPEPNVILITDIHGDHFDLPTLKEILNSTTTLVVPQAVADKIKEKLPGTMIVMKNGENISKGVISIEAVPMYNLPETKEAFHTKGRGNGYIIKNENRRIYISGDTGNIPEMSSFENIDQAFLSMNLPYTMSIEDAVKATLAMKPKQITPYHYRGPDGLSDINKFKEMVEKENPNIKVVLLNFYP